MSANTEAKIRNLPTGWPTALALLPQFVGLALGLLWYSLGGPAIGCLALGVAGAFGTLLLAMMQAGLDSNAATGKAIKYTVVYCIIFPIELIGGGILLLFYVIPYLVVATLVTSLVINGQATRRRDRLASHRDSYGNLHWDGAPLDYGLPPGPNHGASTGPNYEPPPGPNYGPATGPTYDASTGPSYEPPPGPSYEQPRGPSYETPPGPRYESPLEGPQTGPFFDPREQDDPDAPAF